MARIIVRGDQVIVDGQILDTKIEERSFDDRFLNEQEIESWTQFNVNKKEALRLFLDCPISEIANISNRVLVLPSNVPEKSLFELVPELNKFTFSFELDGIISLYQETSAPKILSRLDQEEGIVFRRAHEYLNRKAQGLSMISFGIIFNYDDWKNPRYSPNEFRKAFVSTYTSIPSDFFVAPYTDDYCLTGDAFENIELAIRSDSSSLSLRDIILELIKHVYTSHELTIKNLLSQANTRFLVEYFSFPDEVKTACVQYLQYFYEFLKEIGVEAKVRLDEQVAGATILSVIPEDKDEALENIKLALDIYLRLPSSQIEADMSGIQVQRLNAQIFHLKGQLMLAAATIQQQQSTIQNLQIQQPFSPDVLVLSQQGESKDQEPLLGGIIKVGEAELAEGALSINLAVLLRWLKKKMRMSRSEG